MADLNSQIKGAIAQAFVVLDSLKKEIKLVYGEGPYDPATDTTGPGTQTAVIRGFKYSNNQEQTTGATGEFATLILQSTDIIAAGMTQIVNEADEAIIDGVKWEIYRMGYDPIDATVNLSVRHG